MYPIPITAWETKLTPTSYISQNKGLKITGDCILLENEQDHIKLKCEMQYPGETQTKIRKYELSTDIDPYTYDENEQRIKEKVHAVDINEEFSSQATLYINFKE